MKNFLYGALVGTGIFFFIKLIGIIAIAIVGGVICGIIVYTILTETKEEE